MLSKDFKLSKFNLFIFLLALLLPISVQANKQPQGIRSTEAEISLVDGMAVDDEGNIFISNRDSNIISKIDLEGKIQPVVGSGTSGFSGDGGQALKAKLKLPAGLTFDNKGNLYIADRENHRIRKVDTNGTITTVAGNGTAGFSGDGGLAIKASLNLPSGVAVDDEGRVFIADRSNNRIRIVNNKGTIKTYAGTGTQAWGGDGGLALKAHLNRPFGLALDKDQNLYIADRGNNRIRVINSSGIINSVAGDGAFFFIGDNGPAYRASLAGPTGITVDDKGNVYIADRANNRIRMVDSNGLIRTVAGTGQQDYNGDGELARETNLHLPFAIAIDKDGKLLIVDRSHYIIRKIDPRTGSVKTIAGNRMKKFRGDGGPANGASLNFPQGIVVDKNDNIIFSDKQNHRIRKITPDGIIETIAGNGKRGNIGDGKNALEASLYNPSIIALNPKDELFFISPSGFISLVRKINHKGIIDQVLSTADKHYKEALYKSTMGLSATSKITEITQISHIVFDKKGNMYFSDRINHQIRKMDTKGKVTTIAGTGSSDFSGDGGQAIKATFADPTALTFDTKGNLYIADSSNDRIRKIDTKGIVTTIAGNGDLKEIGDGGPAIEAGIRDIDDLRFSPNGELYIVSGLSSRIRKINKDGIIVTVAGRGVEGYFGDGGPSFRALLKMPSGIAFDSKGNTYITDMGNNRIRKIDTKGIITTIAGSGTYGWGQDGETIQIITQNFP